MYLCVHITNADTDYKMIKAEKTEPRKVSKIKFPD